MERVFEFKKANKVKVTIDDNFVYLFRKGIINAINVGFSGEKKISLNDIRSVQLKKPGLSYGYLQFSLYGTNERQGSYKVTTDENSILFNKSELHLAEEIKSIIDEIIENRVKRENTDNIQNDPTEELRKYKALLDDGIITQEEFDAKKKQLLDL